MGKNDSGEDGSVDVILPDGFGSSFSTQQIRAKVILDWHYYLFRNYIFWYPMMGLPYTNKDHNPGDV